MLQFTWNNWTCYPQFTDASSLRWYKQLWPLLICVSGMSNLSMSQKFLIKDGTLYRFASGYGNLNHLGNVNISPADTPILCGIIAAVVQCFFAYRIFTLRRSYLWICILIVLVRSMHVRCMSYRKLTKSYPYHRHLWCKRLGLWGRVFGLVNLEKYHHFFFHCFLTLGQIIALGLHYSRVRSFAW